MSGLSIGKMSPHTRELFLSVTPIQEQTWLKLGRVSMVAHAEAVTKAVAFCFLCIKAIFSRAVTEEQLNKQWEECSAAYAVSLRSLMAFFDPKALALEPAPVPRAAEPVAEPAPQFQAPQPAAPAAMPRRQSLQLHAFDEEWRVGDPARVQEKLDGEMRRVLAQGSDNEKRGFDYLHAEGWFKLDARTTHSSHSLGRQQVGICRFSDAQDKTVGQQLAVSFNLRIRQTNCPVQVFGIFDAFGGPQAANFLKTRLAEVLAKRLREDSSSDLSEAKVRDALKLTFVELHDNFISKTKNLFDLDAGRYFSEDGATATVCVVIDKKFWIANLGRGRAVYIKDGEAAPLSRETIPELFKDGIAKRKGNIENGLLDGKLPTAKAVGFNGLKGLSSRPKITAVNIPDGGYIVIGSQSFFKQCSTQELAAALDDNKTVEPAALALNLVFSAREMGCDTACIVVKVKPEIGNFEPLDLEEVKSASSGPASSQLNTPHIIDHESVHSVNSAASSPRSDPVPAVAKAASVGQPAKADSGMSTPVLAPTPESGVLVSPASPSGSWDLG